MACYTAAGKTRLAKYYVPFDDGEKRGVEYDVHKLIASRDPKHTNFVEVRVRVGREELDFGAKLDVAYVLQYKGNKIIYRRYAGLFFSLCIDSTDNELAYLESIHLFVEILDHYFSNVCELDLVFNFHKVQAAHFLMRAKQVRKTSW